jgi:hypothetical protein
MTSRLLVLFAFASIGIACRADAQSQGPRQADPARTPSTIADDSVATPTNLRECYMRVAMTKANPDAMYLAREICNSLFKKLDPASLALFDAKTGKCTEWFFDADGRYETADMYCSLEPRGENKFGFACEGKEKKRFTFAELTRIDHRYEKSNVKGYDVGALFATLASCVEYKAAQPGMKSE